MIKMRLKIRFGSEPDLAGGLGFEPRQPESESGVLPLDDPPITLRQSLQVKGPFCQNRESVS
jgi:hypothetical protein